MSSKALSAAKEAAISAAISAANISAAISAAKEVVKAVKEEATAARIAATKVKNGMIIAAENLTGRELKQSGITTSVKVVKANKSKVKPFTFTGFHIYSVKTGGMAAKAIIEGEKTIITLPKTFLNTVVSFDRPEAREAVKTMLLDAYRAAIEAKPNIEKAVTTAKTAQKITKVRNVLSMENLAVQLLTNKASEKEIEAAFVAAYATKGNTDLKFIKARIAIYLHIAQK